MTPPFANRVSSQAKERQGLIDVLAKRFYVNEQATLISNGLSTEFLYFPSDLAPSQRPYLQEKIRNAIGYATAFYDVEELNALRLLHPDAADFNLTLGLYLYFADECSRLRPNTTFLSELRRAKVTAPAGETPDRAELYRRAGAMLEHLGMKESHGEVLREWYEHGRYHIQGEPHALQEGGVLSGAYALLGRAIASEGGKWVPLNLAISYALGNKSDIQDLSPEAAYAFTAGLTQNRQSTMVHPHIRACIQRGDAMRENRILDIMKHLSSSSVPPSPEAAQLARRLFDTLPTSALQLLYQEGYTFAYSDDTNIGRCYPKDKLPGNTDEDHATFRTNQGHRQIRYRILFLSNGIRNKPEEVETYRDTTLTQTLMHETMHIALSHLTEEEKSVLWKQADAVAAALHQHRGLEVMHRQPESAMLPSYFHRRLRSLSSHTLVDVLDSSAYPYKKYRESARREEVVCNLAGLMYSDFPYPPAPGAPDPYSALPSLGVLAQSIETVLSRAADMSRERLATVNAPAPSGTGIAAF